MATFNGKYRIASTRLKGWNYTTEGWYFVTICTKDRANFLGEVIDAQAQLSTIGQIVAEEWQKTEQIRDRVTLDEWVIMPNHLHGIIVIDGSHTATGGRDGSATRLYPRWGG